MRKNSESAEQPKPAKKVVPRGQALERSDADLDEMCSAKNMEALADEAAEEFREGAPREYSKLLDAKQKEK
jgi:hypothetical protein